MGAIVSQITSLTIVYSIVYSDADQRKHQSSASLAFVREIHRGPANSPHKWPVTRKMFPFDDVIMIQCVSNATTVLLLLPDINFDFIGRLSQERQHWNTWREKQYWNRASSNALFILYFCSGQSFSFVSGNGLVLSDNKPFLSKPMLRKFGDTIWHNA